MRKHRIAVMSVRFFSLVLVALVLNACNQSTEQKLRVATNVWPGYETLYLARNLGFFNQSNIRMVEMTSASQVSHAIVNGTVEAAALTLDETLNLLQDPKVDIRVILIMDVSNGADVLLAGHSVHQLNELKNKRIGVENTATGAVLLDAALQRAGLNTEDVKIVPMTVNTHQKAWENQEVDAIVTFEPVRSALLSLGAHVLFDSSQIPGTIVDVLVVRADAMKKHEKSLKTLVAAHFSALRYLAENTNEAAKKMAPRLAANHTDQVLSQFEGLKLPDLTDNWLWLSGTQPNLIKSSNELVNLMLKHQLLAHSVNLNTLAEPSFLPELAR